MGEFSDGGLYALENGVTHELCEALYFSFVREDEVDVPVVCVPLGELLSECVAFVLLEDEVSCFECA